MSETNDTTRRGKTLTLKKTETSTVKQSFSHGRTKAVVVEKKRARVAPAAAKPAAEAAEKPAAKPVEAKAPAPSPAPKPAARDGGRGGVVLRELTEEEKEARSRALAGARVADEAARKQAEEDRRRREIEEAQLAIEREAAAKRKAEEDARHKAEEEARKHAEEELHRRDKAGENSDRCPCRSDACRCRAHGRGATCPPSRAGRRRRREQGQENSGQGRTQGAAHAQDAGRSPPRQAYGHQGAHRRRRAHAFAGVLSPPSAAREGPSGPAGRPRRSARHHDPGNHHGRRIGQPHGAPRRRRHQGADEERHDGDGQRHHRCRHRRTGGHRIRPYRQARGRIRRARRPEGRRGCGRDAQGASAGRHRHGPCRPRQDLAARCAQEDRCRGWRSRRHHPAYRRLSGAAQIGPEDHLPRHARPCRLHGHARARRPGDRHCRACGGRR